MVPRILNQYQYVMGMGGGGGGEQHVTISDCFPPYITLAFVHDIPLHNFFKSMQFSTNLALTCIDPPPISLFFQSIFSKNYLKIPFSKKSCCNICLHRLDLPAFKRSTYNLYICLTMSSYTPHAR